VTRRHIDFDMLPQEGVVRIADGHPLSRWRHAEAGQAAFSLTPVKGRFPSGWVLMNGRLVRRAADYSARLYIDTGRGFEEGASIAPPITLKGTLHELVNLPRGIRAMRWVVMESPGEFEQSPLVMTEIGIFERVWRMVRRIVPMFFKHRSEKRERIGLTPWRMLVGLQESYHAAGLLRAYTPALSYRRWIERYERLSAQDRRRILSHMERMSRRPFFSVVMPVFNAPPEFLRAAIESVRQQMYPHWELCIADDASTETEVREILDEFAAADERIRVVYREVNGHISEASNSALALAQGEYVVLLDQDDLLPEHALYWIAAELEQHPDAVVIYSDEDKIDEYGRRFEPYFKPDWNPQLILSQNFVSHLGVYRREALRAAGGFRRGFEGSQDYDLLLRVTEGLSPIRIRHVPAILYHWRAAAGSTALDAGEKCYAWEAGRKALAEHLARTGVDAEVLETEWGSCYRVRYALPIDKPLVSIVVPTRDRFDLLHCCIESILSKTVYDRYEILVVDNQTVERRALKYLAVLRNRPRMTVLCYDQPFNYSAINNFAAQHARGEVLCLLNNDTEVLSPDWMEEMLGCLTQPGVGIVGARLLYPDNTVQHGGVLVGVGGVANHAHAFRPRQDPGYFGRALLAQDFSAVTGACLMIRKSLFEKLGGMDEKGLAVAFNDVDLCLKARQAGWRIVWTPYAELYHHESVSRGSDDTPEKQARHKAEAACMRTRWEAFLARDPFYNPNLSVERPDFSLSHTPSVVLPWRRPHVKT
jgi:GT2 family glycosyltransferase